MPVLWNYLFLTTRCSTSALNHCLLQVEPPMFLFSCSPSGASHLLLVRVECAMYTRFLYVCSVAKACRGAQSQNSINQRPTVNTLKWTFTISKMHTIADWFSQGHCAIETYHTHPHYKVGLPIPLLLLALNMTLNISFLTYNQLESSAFEYRICRKRGLEILN